MVASRSFGYRSQDPRNQVENASFFEDDPGVNPISVTGISKNRFLGLIQESIETYNELRSFLSICIFARVLRVHCCSQIQESCMMQRIVERF